MDDARRKELAKWTRDLIISVVLVPAFLALLQMSPLVIIIGGLCSLAILKVWENWPLLRAKFRLGAALAIFCLLCMFGAGGWYVWNIPTSTKPAPPIPPFERPSPLISRADKFIFACDVPLDPHVTPKQQAQSRIEVERDVKAWGAMLGFAVTVSDVEGGIQITVEANTIEGKNRLLSAGVSPLATKLILEMRRIGPRIMVTAYPDLPQEFSIFSLFPADPSSPQVAPAEKQVSKMLGWPEGTCHVI